MSYYSNYTSLVGGSSADGGAIESNSLYVQSSASSNLVSEYVDLPKRTTSIYGTGQYSTSTMTTSHQPRPNSLKNDSLSLKKKQVRIDLSGVEDNSFHGDIESAIMKSNRPIEVDGSEIIEINGEKGIWANKEEVLNWKSNSVPLKDYPVNEDPNPVIIRKKCPERIEYVQELAIRYLRPPTPPSPGDIIVTVDPGEQIRPAPPIVIRQQPPRPNTPEPLVIREAPPVPPPQQGRKLIIISGKKVPPPPRKVIIERLAPLPAKPPAVLLERWLPYPKLRRRVILNKPPEAPYIAKPKNVIVQWEAPQVNVRQEVKYLGVIRANPAEYIDRYRNQIRQPHELPDFVHNIPTPNGLALAASQPNQDPTYPLYGDLHALNLVDLEREGLAEYKNLNFRSGSVNRNSPRQQSPTSPRTIPNNLSDIIERTFLTVSRDLNCKINIDDAECLYHKLNAQLGRMYNLNNVKEFFTLMDINNDGTVDLKEFKRAFVSLI